MGDVGFVPGAALGKDRPTGVVNVLHRVFELSNLLSVPMMPRSPGVSQVPLEEYGFYVRPRHVDWVFRTATPQGMPPGSEGFVVFRYPYVVEIDGGQVVNSPEGSYDVVPPTGFSSRRVPTGEWAILSMVFASDRVVRATSCTSQGHSGFLSQYAASSLGSGQEEAPGMEVFRGWSLEQVLTVDSLIYSDGNNPVLGFIPSLLSLGELVVSNTDGVIVPQLHGLPSLQKIEVSRSRNVIFEGFNGGSYPSLQVLRLKNVGLSDLSIVSNLDVPKGNLSLDLSENYIQNLAPIEGATWITDLDLAYNYFNDLSPLANMTQLVRLNVGYPGKLPSTPERLRSRFSGSFPSVLGNASLEHLQALSALEFLGLQQTAVTTLGPLFETFKNSPSKKPITVDLTGSKWDTGNQQEIDKVLEVQRLTVIVHMRSPVGAPQN